MESWKLTLLDSVKEYKKQAKRKIRVKCHDKSARSAAVGVIQDYGSEIGEYKKMTGTGSGKNFNIKFKEEKQRDTFFDNMTSVLNEATNYKGGVTDETEVTDSGSDTTLWVVLGIVALAIVGFIVYKKFM